MIPWVMPDNSSSCSRCAGFTPQMFSAAGLCFQWRHVQIWRFLTPSTKQEIYDQHHGQMLHSLWRQRAKSQLTEPRWRWWPISMPGQPVCMSVRDLFFCHCVGLYTGIWAFQFSLLFRCHMSLEHFSRIVIVAAPLKCLLCADCFLP